MKPRNLVNVGIGLGVMATCVLPCWGQSVLDTPYAFPTSPTNPTVPDGWTTTPALVALPDGTTLVDYVDIGNPTGDPGWGTEADHGVYECVGQHASSAWCWGPVATWGGSSERPCYEQTAGAGGSDVRATVTMDFGQKVTHKYVAVLWLWGAAAGSCDTCGDSWDLSISGQNGQVYSLINTEPQSNGDEIVGVWDVGIVTGVRTLTFAASNSAWSGQDTYGQAMISEVAVWAGPEVQPAQVDVELVILSEPSTSDTVGFDVCQGMNFGDPCVNDGDCFDYVGVPDSGVCLPGMATLPSSETQVNVGDTFYVEVWMQTTEPGGITGAYVDIPFDNSKVTALSITNTPVFYYEGGHGTIDSNGLIDDLGDVHQDFSGSCAQGFAHEPTWARVAYVEFSADAAGSVDFQSATTGSGYGISICGELGLLDPGLVNYGGAALQIEGETGELILDVPDAPQIVPVGQPVEVELKVANLSTAINGVQAIFHYDTEKLALVTIEPVSPWNQEIDETDISGDVSYSVGITGGSTADDGTVAVMTFTALQEGTPLVTFLDDYPTSFPTLKIKLTEAATAQAITPVAIDTLAGDIVIIGGDCLINGQQYGDGTPNPLNECEICDSSQSVTEWTPLTGTSCDDGDPCNVGEMCNAGICSGGVTPDCSTNGDQCNSASCDPLGDEGNCDVLTPINEGLTCDDGDVCLIGETCQSGYCTGGVAPDCSTNGDQCNSASCDPAGDEGNCDVMTPINEGLTCNDGDVCLIGETCQSGYCTGGIAPDCSTNGDQCNSASCDPGGSEGNCDDLTPINEGLTCDDGDVCLIGETCQSGYCTGGITPDCSTNGDQCNSASCDPGGNEGNCDSLTPINEGLTCDDGDVCLIGETCQSGYCTGGVAPDCSTNGDQCNSSSCDPVGDEGNCDVLTPINEGLTCDDGYVCLTGETCQSGYCTGGIAPDCSTNGDQCNSASCDPYGNEGNCDSLTPINEGMPCNDGLYCTNPDICSSGFCGGPDRDCGDSDPCTTDTCNEEIDQCVNVDGTFIDIAVQVEGLGNAVSRDVSFVMTDCDGDSETVIETVDFDANGYGYVTFTMADLAVEDLGEIDYIQATEGHTLSRLVSVEFYGPDYCYAEPQFTSDNMLLAGDFSNSYVTQDNLVDIGDFAVLAIEWNHWVDPNQSSLADVTGDGFQNVADFTAIQANFAEVGDDVDACPATLLDYGMYRDVRTQMSIVGLPARQVRAADRNNDGLIDITDIRAFAKEEGLTLTPKFHKKLERLERAGMEGMEDVSQHNRLDRVETGRSQATLTER